MGHEYSIIPADTEFVPCYTILHYSLFSMTLVTFIYGVISWCLIKKFRNFNNYVYLSATIVNIMRLIVISIIFLNCDEIVVKIPYIEVYFYIFMFLSTVYHYWLVVMCYVFYVKLVKVFNGDMKRKYLKSTLFSWGLPVLIVFICRFALFIIEQAIDEENTQFSRKQFISNCMLVVSHVIPTAINSLIFIELLYSLFCSKESNASSLSKKERIKEKWRRLYTATSIFFLSNVFVLYFLIWTGFHFSMITRYSTMYIQLLAVTIFIPLVKSNRVVWKEYYKTRLSRIMS